MRAIDIVKNFWKSEIDKMTDEQLAFEIFYFCRGMKVDLSNPRKALLEARILIHSDFPDEIIFYIYEEKLKSHSVSDVSEMPQGTNIKN